MLLQDRYPYLMMDFVSAVLVHMLVLRSKTSYAPFVCCLIVFPTLLFVMPTLVLRFFGRHTEQSLDLS